MRRDWFRALLLLSCVSLTLTSTTFADDDKPKSEQEDKSDSAKESLIETSHDATLDG